MYKRFLNVHLCAVVCLLFACIGNAHSLQAKRLAQLSRLLILRVSIFAVM